MDTCMYVFLRMLCLPSWLFLLWFLLMLWITPSLVLASSLFYLRSAPISAPLPVCVFLRRLRIVFFFFFPFPVKLGGMCDNEWLSPPLTPRRSPPCLSVSPALADVCASGWRTLALLIFEAEDLERHWWECEEYRLRGRVVDQAQNEKRCNASQKNEEGDEGSNTLNRHLRTRECVVTPSSLPKAAAERSCSSSVSPLSARYAADVPATPPLTPYQRFCFTKSTAAKYSRQASAARNAQPQPHRPPPLSCATQRTTFFLASHPEEKMAVSSLAAPLHDYADGCTRAAEWLSPRSGPTTLAAAFSPRRDVWSWSHSRSRNTSAPTAVPTLSRTYGSAERRAVSMELIFNRLSYKGKALVARQVESLGLLTKKPAFPASRWEEGAPSRQIGADEQVGCLVSLVSSSSSALQHDAAPTPLGNADATVLECAGDGTLTAADGDGDTRHRKAASTGRLSLAPVGPD
jgi:hypothetical protein